MAVIYVIVETVAFDRTAIWKDTANPDDSKVRDEPWYKIYSASTHPEENINQTARGKSYIDYLSKLWTLWRGAGKRKVRGRFIWLDTFEVECLEDPEDRNRRMRIVIERSSPENRKPKVILHAYSTDWEAANEKMKEIQNQCADDGWRRLAPVSVEMVNVV